MTDLKERLLGWSRQGSAVSSAEIYAMTQEAAAEIARLQAEVERLKAERHTTKRMLEEVLSRHGLPRP
jgi:uncharacterized small protein (DUF1192 family)